MTKAKETKEKAPVGSSIPAQSKTLVAALGAEIDGHFKETEKDGQAAVTVTIFRDTFDWLQNLSAEIISKTQRGLPLEVKLQNVQNQIDVLKKTIIENGNLTAEQDAEFQTLFVERNKLQKQVAKAASSPEN